MDGRINEVLHGSWAHFMLTLGRCSDGHGCSPNEITTVLSHQRLLLWTPLAFIYSLGQCLLRALLNQALYPVRQGKCGALPTHTSPSSHPGPLFSPMPPHTLPSPLTPLPCSAFYTRIPYLGFSDPVNLHWTRRREEDSQPLAPALSPSSHPTPGTWPSQALPRIPSHPASWNSPEPC